jgi:hypothetical protein
MTTGDSKSGLYFSIVLIKFAVLSGENLQALLKEVDRHIGIVTCFHYTVVLSHLMAYRETVSTLIDKGHHTRSENNTKDPYEGVSTSSAIEVEKLKERLKESIFTNRTLQAFWRGQVQRCHHFATKGADYQAGGQQSKLIISFVSLNNYQEISLCYSIPPRYAHITFTLVLCPQLIPRDKKQEWLREPIFQSKAHIQRCRCYIETCGGTLSLEFSEQGHLIRSGNAFVRETQ